ncbi:hypothetical protein [Sphingomonas bisphenolicum]|uniref:Uncharacterized protein n=1 Tax=Sphingomonas bisphenolicum TaxID=296544 RepID=A0ABM7G2Q8_9SPHN|nr:hypothetical protein [Sphingomonas bisphenolicum]BBF70176.1 hypothetical protein SBA_ch1_23760 [Sphingomonas bisphenolicum]
MKIPVGKIAVWIGRALLSAIVSEAADRLSRSKPADDRRDQGGDREDADHRRLDRE